MIYIRPSKYIMDLEINRTLCQFGKSCGWSLFVHSCTCIEYILRKVKSNKTEKTFLFQGCAQNRQHLLIQKKSVVLKNFFIELVSSMNPGF